MPNQFSKPDTPLGQSTGKTRVADKATSNCGEINKQLGTFYKDKSQYNYEPGISPSNGGKNSSGC